MTTSHFLDCFENCTAVQPKKRASQKRKNNDKHESDDSDDSDDSDSDHDNSDDLNSRLLIDNNNSSIDTKDLYSNNVYPRKPLLQQCLPTKTSLRFVELISANLTPATYGTFRLLLHHMASSGWENIRPAHSILDDTPNDAARQRG